MRLLVFRQQGQGRADEGVGFLQLRRRQFEAIGQRYVEGAGDEQTKGDGLRIAIGELVVAGVGKEQIAPVLRQRRKAGVAQLDLLQHLIAQQAAQARRHLRKASGVARGLGRPAQEIADERGQGGGRGELEAGAVQLAVEVDDLARQLPIAPQAETDAIGIEQVRQGLELAPLFLVVRIGEFAGIGPLARRLHFDEAHQRLADRDRIIGPQGQMGKRCLPHQIDVGVDAANRREGFDEDLKRRPQLILGGALDGGIGEFGFGADAEGRDRVGKGGGFRQGLILEVT